MHPSVCVGVKVYLIQSSCCFAGHWNQYFFCASFIVKSSLGCLSLNYVIEDLLNGYFYEQESIAQVL